MKRGVVLAAIIPILMLLLTGAHVFVPGTSGPAAKATSTYANSQVDTVHYGRPVRANSLSFAIEFADSFKITNAILRRVVDGSFAAVRAGDTLFTADSSTAGAVKIVTVAVDPMPDEYVVIVTYGADKNGFTTPTVKYVFGQKLL